MSPDRRERVDAKVNAELTEKTLTKHILELIGGNGYSVLVGRQEANAMDITTGENHRVTFEGQDIYPAACELARFVGVKLEGGSQLSIV